MGSLTETAPAVNVRLPRVGCCLVEHGATRAAFAGCGFGARTLDALSREGISTPAKLRAHPAEELRHLPGIGKKGLAEILRWRGTALLAGNRRRFRSRRRAHHSVSLHAQLAPGSFKAMEAA